MSTSVQFRDKESALAAFNNVECEAWSVWQNKQLLFKGIGSGDLSAFLDMLSESSTNAVYTIRYYEEITEKKHIKNDTAFDGSFNFKLNSDGQEINGAQYSGIRNNNELLSRVNGLDTKFDMIMSKLEEEEEEEEPNRLGIIGDIIGHPAIAPLIPQFISLLMGVKPGDNAPQYIPATVGNIPDTKLNEAIERLKLFDDKLSDHLTKLANLAEKDPATFEMIMKSLEAYKM